MKRKSKMSAGDFLQQGDVIIRKIEGLPSNLKSLNHRVLAEGETTGHCHQIAEKELSDLYCDEKGNLFLHAEKPVILKHNVHNPVKIPKGDYVVDRVMEYDHFAEEARRVQD
jgi:hypothetical protein